MRGRLKTLRPTATDLRLCEETHPAFLDNTGKVATLAQNHNYTKLKATSATVRCTILNWRRHTITHHPVLIDKAVSQNYMQRTMQDKWQNGSTTSSTIFNYL